MVILHHNRPFIGDSGHRDYASYAKCLVLRTLHFVCTTATMMRGKAVETEGLVVHFSPLSSSPPPPTIPPYRLLIHKPHKTLKCKDSLKVTDCCVDSTCCPAPLRPPLMGQYLQSWSFHLAEDDFNRFYLLLLLLSHLADAFIRCDLQCVCR